MPRATPLMLVSRMATRLRRKLHRARLGLADAADLLTGLRKPMTPSRLQIDSVGGGDFHVIGAHLSRLAIDLGELQPHETILDIGCGVGRLAVPLTTYLTSGHYSGFDVSPSAIRWCRRAISSRHSNFHFAVVDVFSRQYNRRGTIPPEEFSFPCQSESIDVAFLGSILTHLQPAAAARYIAETARVVKPGGRAVVSFFLLDETVRRRLQRGELLPNFNTYPEPYYALQEAENPEAAVAYDLKVVEEAIRGSGLSVSRVARGSWSDHGHAPSYQDIVVARKDSR